MKALKVATYFLTGFANVEILVAIALTITALATNHKLYKKSRIMIAFVPVLELIRVAICNLHVMETYHPEWMWLSDLWCLVVARWGLYASMAAIRWLLAAIAIHMYLLCVKLRSHINTTKTSITICASILICSVLMGVIGTFCNMYFSNHGVNTNSNLMVTSEHELLIFKANRAMPNIEENGTETRSSKMQMNFSKDTNNQDVKMCRDRKHIMTFTDQINEALFMVNIALPLAVKLYFYSKINEHLNNELERFQSNQQVVNRLDGNNRAILRMLLASFICHFIFFIPMIAVVYFKLSQELELLTRILTLNATTGAAICFLILHGGFR